MGIPDKDFLREYVFSPLPSARGCAFLGSTDFDKLGAVKNFLLEQGVVELEHKSDFEDCFVVHDCRGKAQKVKSIAGIAAKYRDIPYVIFDNCEQILKNLEVIRIFVHLIDKFDYFGSYSFTNSKNIEETFSTSSFYVFLGKENLLPKPANYAPNTNEQDRIASFLTFIQCYDFNTNSQIWSH